MSFSFPIRDDAGQIVGVWTNRFNWAAAEDIVAADLKRVRANGAKTEAVVLRDRRGRVLIPTGGKAETDGKVSESFRSTGFSTYPGLGWSVLATQDESEALGAATDLRNQMLAIALLVALLIGAIAYLIARAVARRVGEYAGFAGRVATGDLSARLSVNGSSDELATLGIHLNDMVDGLARVSGQVQEGAQAITASTNEIVAAVNQQTASATEQSAAITQTSTSVEEIRVAAEQAAMKAEEVARQAETSVEVGDEGGRAVEAIASGMTDIQDRVDAIAQDILALSERTQQIGEITRTVNDLADQSNLLAFNATIEAAKAGEQGKGFAVVADEVRNLAEQSKQATAQVQAILGEIQKATNAAVMAAEQGTTTVQAGTELAQRAGVRIAQLADVNREAAQAAQQIAALARQQNAGMDQIAQAMGETSQATTQFVAGARESQTAAGHLDQVARELNEMAAAYKI
jgi:methyl-accepting chemotaxis protein